MIGTHLVTILGAAPTIPINRNPYMTANVNDWQAGAFEESITWAAGQARQARGGGIFPGQLSVPVARVAGDVTYKVRVRMTKGKAGPVTVGLFVGDSADAVWGGPFWRPGHSEQMHQDFGDQPAGLTRTYEADFFVPASWHPEFPYIGPNIQTFYEDAGGPAQLVDGIELWVMPGALADLTCLVDDLTIQHGRADTTSQPNASSCTVNLTADAADPTEAALMRALEVGVRLTVDTTVPGYPSVRRFTGRVSDLNMGWDEAGAATPDAGVGQVVAVGTMADLGRRNVGAEPWPAELDGARVSRVAALAGISLDPFASDPGTVQIRARDVDSQPALAVMQGVAGSAMGMVWATREGELSYADADHRRGIPTSLALDVCDLYVTPTWTRNLDGLTNDVSIGYGVGDSGGGEQPRVGKVSDSSITKWGRYAFTTGTELAALADATAMANLLLNRNAEPVWVLSDLPVVVEDLDAADTYALLALDVHALISLTGMPAIGNAPTSFPAWVEGWTERLAADSHEITLAVSGYCRTSPPVRWNEPTVTTWNTVDPANRTWDGSVCWGPIVGVGRWDDNPASLRWDQVAEASTWDTWT